MDTAGLTAFLCVAREKSFSKAANELCLTQSAVSKRIAQLELQLDCKLFDRIGRQIDLTEAGETLLPIAQRIVNDLVDAQRQLHNLSGQVVGKLSLAASHHISLHRLPETLRRYIERFPEVELDLRFYESEVAYEAVVRGDIELALITLSPEADERICSETIWTDHLQYVVSNHHPLAKIDRPGLSEINAYPAILPASNTFTTRIVQDHLAQLGLTPNIASSTNYLDTIKMMVSIGLGWSLLPETLIDRQLTPIPIAQQPIERPLGYIYHRDRTLSNAARELVSLLKNNRPIAS